MNLHLKNAVQALDLHIMEAQAARETLVRLMTNEEASPVAAPVAAATVQTDGRNGQKEQKKKAPPLAGGDALSPMSEGMLKLGLKIREPFDAEKLAGFVGCTTKHAANAISRWHINKFVDRVGRGVYQRTTKFPGAKVVPLPEPEPSPSEPEKKTVENRGARPSGVSYGTANDGGGPATMPVIEEKLTPYSPKGVALGKQLKTVFTMDELSALLPNGKQQAYYFASQWRNRNWIRKEDFDVYRKEATFGQ